jgi:hypothetical protein
LCLEDETTVYVKARARRRIENRDFGSCNSASISYDSQSSKLSRFFFFCLIRFSQNFVCS